MAMATTLVEAAHLSYVQGNIKRIANTLTANYLGFCDDLTSLFPESTSTYNNRTVSNWIIPMRALVSTLPGTGVSAGQLNSCVEYLYRVCFAASAAVTDGRLDPSVGPIIIAAWNTRFGT